MHVATSMPTETSVRNRVMHRVYALRRWIGGGVLILIVLGGSLCLPGLLAKADTSTAAPAVPGQRLLPVETTLVTADAAYQVSRAYTGLVEARRSSALGFERPGKLVTLTVDAGTRVAQGALLATLDTQALRAARHDLVAQRAQALARLAELRAGARPQTIAATRAQVHEQQTALALAQRRHNSRQTLLAKGFIARETVDEVTADLYITQARLDAAQRRLDELLAGTRHEQIQAQEALLTQVAARLQGLDVELQQSQLKAPFAGTIVARLVDEGTVIAAAQPVVRLIEDTHLEVHVGVPPDVAVMLVLGSAQRVQVGQTVHSARVTALVPELDGTTRTVTVVLTFPAHLDGTVLPGQVARLQLTETVESAGFWLPITALSKGPHGLWSCFALVPASGIEQPLFRTEHRTIDVLHTENERVFVRGLLHAGEHIVTSGTHRLVAGQLVRPAA